MAMSKTGKVFLILGGIFLAVFLVAVIGIALLMSAVGKPEVPENSVLVLNVTGETILYVFDNPASQGKS
jgi:hypothetical protein